MRKWSFVSVQNLLYIGSTFIVPIQNLVHIFHFGWGEEMAQVQNV